MTDKHINLLQGRQPTWCPYCRKDDCNWAISSIAGPASAEVRTACGQALSVDSLLGKIRWHLEAAAETMARLRPATGPKS